MKIIDGCSVTIDYNMRLEDGEVIDSTDDTDPLTYTQGEGEIIAGLEKAMAGMEKGASQDIVVPAVEAFGEADPEALIEVPKGDLPKEALESGAELQAQGPQGQTISGRVVEVRDNTAVVDFNHPLAGKPLHCSVTIVDVRQEPSS
jgi:FKBP-type peptidyl-prolyl cis-trans isomerase SlyD